MRRTPSAKRLLQVVAVLATLILLTEGAPAESSSGGLSRSSSSRSSSRTSRSGSDFSSSGSSGSRSSRTSSRNDDSSDDDDEDFDSEDSGDSRSRGSSRRSSSSRSGGGSRSFSTGGGGKSGSSGSKPELPPLVFGTKFERDGVRPRGTLMSQSAFRALPCTRQPVEVNGTTYYRCDDAWYQSIEQEGWTCYSEIWPPAGAQVSSLPEKHITLQSAGRTLYAGDHGWYERSPSGGFVVIEPPIGLPLDQLPETAKRGIPVVVNGVTYYRHLGVFYKEEGEGAPSRYSVAKSPFADMPVFAGQSSGSSRGSGSSRSSTSGSRSTSSMSRSSTSARSSTSR